MVTRNLSSSTTPTNLSLWDLWTKPCSFIFRSFAPTVATTAAAGGDQELNELRRKKLRLECTKLELEIERIPLECAKLELQIQLLQRDLMSGQNNI